MRLPLWFVFSYCSFSFAISLPLSFSSLCSLRPFLQNTKNTHIYRHLRIHAHTHRIWGQCSMYYSLFMREYVVVCGIPEFSLKNIDVLEVLNQKCDAEAGKNDKEIICRANFAVFSRKLIKEKKSFSQALVRDQLKFDNYAMILMRCLLFVMWKSQAANRQTLLSQNAINMYNVYD